MIHENQLTAEEMSALMNKAGTQGFVFFMLGLFSLGAIPIVWHLWLSRQWQPKAGNDFIIDAPDGRVFLLPRSAVAKDYMEFLMDQDGLSLREAQATVDRQPEFLDTWFSEQFFWEDVERLGMVLVHKNPESMQDFLPYRDGSPAECVRRSR